MATATHPVAGQSGSGELSDDAAIDAYCNRQASDDAAQTALLLDTEQAYVRDQLCTLCSSGSQEACGMLVELLEPVSGPTDQMREPDAWPED